MPQQIHAPNGEIVEFPDGMDDNAIASVMRQSYGGPDERPVSQGLGLFRGTIRPLDNAALAAEAGLEKIGVPVRDFQHSLGAQSAQDAVNTRRAAFEASPVRPGAIGDVVGGIIATAPMALLPGGVVAQGAAMGAANTEHRDLKGVATDAALGGVFGKVGEGVVNAVGKHVTEIARPVAKTLREAGIKLTPGQAAGGRAMVREDKLMSKPVVGAKIAADRAAGIEQFNRALIDKALAPIQVRLPAEVRSGHDAVAFAQQAISDAYERIIPKLSLSVDDKLFAGMQEVANEARMLPQAAREAVVNAVKGSGFTEGQLAGTRLQAARSDLRRLASNYSRSSVAGEREAGRVLQWVNEHVDDALLRQNPKLAGGLQRANAAHARQVVIDDAASRTDDGLFSTGQARQAARRADLSRRKKASARGEGPMGDFINAASQVLPSKTPNSFTADRLQANAIQSVIGVGRLAAYNTRNAITGALAKLPEGSGNAIRRAAKPVARGTALVPSALAAKERR